MANRIETKDERLNKVVCYVEEYFDATPEARRISEKCRDYFDGYQWTEVERKKLEKRGQPCITNNRIKPKVQFLKGMEAQNRSDPKALPREPNDDKSGEVITDALRFVEETEHCDQKLSEGFMNYIIEGVEGFEVIGRPKKDRVDVEVNNISWDRLIWDPHSRRKDFSDAMYLGTFDWMDEDQAKTEFPKAPDEFFVFEEKIGSDTETSEDRPFYFIDKKRKRVCVYYLYYLNGGKWMYCIFSGGGFAVDPTDSPYLNEDEEPSCPLVFQSAFVDRNGNRYGEVASYLDIQDEINKRRSKFLHLVSVRQTFSKQGAIDDVNKFKAQLSKPDGHVEFNPMAGEFNKDFGIFPTGDMAEGQLGLLQEAKQEIDIVSVNAVMEGRTNSQLSGRAVQSLQQGGTVELGSLFDGHQYCKLRIYREIFNRIKQFWTEERWVRVLGSDKDIKFTGINRKITVREKLIEEFGQIPPEYESDPRLDTVIDVENKVGEIDVDIIIDTAQDTLTLQHEQFELLAQMYQSNPQAVPFELVIKASQLRNKEELLQMLKGGTPEQQEAAAQAKAQQEAEQMELIKAAAISKLEREKAATEKDLASAGKIIEEAKQIKVETAIGIDSHTMPNLERGVVDDRQNT